MAGRRLPPMPLCHRLPPRGPLAASGLPIGQVAFLALLCCMPVLWLCSVQHHHARVRTASGGPRCRLSLPRRQWLQEALDTHGIPCSWVRVDGSLEHPFHLVGLVQVEQGMPYNGLLTQWSREGFLLRDFFRRPRDGFSGNIAVAFKLHDPIPIYHKTDDRDRIYTVNSTDGVFVPCGLSDQVLQRLGVEVLRAGRQQQQQQQLSIQQWLISCGIQPDGVDALFAHTLVGPLAALAMHGQWTELLFLARWPLANNVFEQYPPDYIRQVARTNDDALDIAPLELAPFQRLIEDLRRWAPRITASCQDEDEVNGQRNCESLMQHLLGNDTWLRNTTHNASFGLAKYILF